MAKKASTSSIAMQVDVGPLLPEARSAVERASQIYVEHTQPWFLGLLVHGSALKGGVIPGCSDIDMQLYLENGAFDAEGRLPLRTALAIARDLAAIDPAPFGYLQCYPRPRCPIETLPSFTGPIPGAYHVIAGSIPVPEATRIELRERAEEMLRCVGERTEAYVNGLLEHGGGRLERAMRLLATDVWPALYAALIVQGADPLDVWQGTKLDAMAMLGPAHSLHAPIQAFYQATLRYYGGETSIERGLDVMENGVLFLGAAHGWYARFAR